MAKLIYTAILILLPNIVVAGEWYAIGSVNINEHEIEDELWDHLNGNLPVELKAREAYSYQYLDKGDNVIYINAFCDTWGRENLKTDLLLVEDGGSCYFQISYSRITKTFSGLSINGEA